MEADEIAKRRRQRMIRIAITQAAFDAIAKTMPLGSVSFEEATDGHRFVWLRGRTIWRSSCGSVR